MTDSLPTLKGLHAFEAAFRFGSYTVAAKRMNVQQPAISYQIKRLEEDLGTELFVRERGRLVPTQAANELFETVSHAFDAIRKTSARLKQAPTEGTITIATYPGIGTYWLSSLLPALSDALSVPVKVITLVKDADILAEDADCRILFGKGDWAGVDARLLMRDAVCPVAAPELAARIVASRAGAFPKGIAIIEQDDPESRWVDWEGWQRQTGDTLQLPSDRMIVNDHGFALHLALAGSGVTLAWLDVVKDLLSGGSLVRLSDKVATSEAGYWLVGRPGFFETPNGSAILKTLQTSEGLP